MQLKGQARALDIVVLQHENSKLMSDPGFVRSPNNPRFGIFRLFRIWPAFLFSSILFLLCFSDLFLAFAAFAELYLAGFFACSDLAECGRPGGLAFGKAGIQTCFRRRS